MMMMTDERVAEIEPTTISQKNKNSFNSMFSILS